ncbi:MAG TPA: tetratricopeptide repeat protein, partial [Armatimonadota bacterium]|nr:tetratricopeptide repeat protein [Armatimonadota bacterium]
YTFNLGVIAMHAGDAEKALSRFQEALRIREEIKAPPLTVAAAQAAVGGVYRSLGDLDAAEKYSGQALETREKLAPGSLELADSLADLFNVAQLRGDFARARELVDRALALDKSRQPPRPDLVARDLNNLGTLVMSEGDLVAAARAYQDAFDTLPAELSSSPVAAICLGNLGIVAQLQGDPRLAREYHLRAERIYRRAGPASEGLTLSLVNLGSIDLKSGDLPAARKRFEEAMQVFSRIGPESLGMVTTLVDLGAVEVEARHYDAAAGYYQRALDLQRKRRFAGQNAAVILQAQAYLRKQRGDLDGAASFYRQALAAAGSLAGQVSTLRSELGNVLAAQGHVEEGERLQRQAWDDVRRQVRDIRGEETRREFSSQSAIIAARLMHCQLARGKQAEALDTAEVLRSLGLQQLLSERQGLLHGAGGKLWDEHRRALADLNTVRRRLERLETAQAAAGDQPSPGATGGPAADAAALRARYLELRRRADDLWAQARAQSPALSDPPAYPRLAAGLRPGDLAVHFTCGDEETHVFLIPPGPSAPLTAYSLPVTAKKLRAGVAAFRAAVASEHTPLPEVTTRGRELFDLLFPAPRRAQVLAARRLVVVPDGPLWDLPFAALVTGQRAGTPAYLGAERPITCTPALALFTRARS